MDVGKDIEWLFLIKALEDSLGTYGYETIAEGWLQLYEGGSVNPEEAGEALHGLKEDGLVYVESDEPYDDVMKEYFPTELRITEKGYKLISDTVKENEKGLLSRIITGIDKKAGILYNLTPNIRKLMNRQ